MNLEDLKSLQEELELKQKELELVLAIDYIRDTALDPTAMLVAIVNVLAFSESSTPGNPAVLHNLGSVNTST